LEIIHVNTFMRERQGSAIFRRLLRALALVVAVVMLALGGEWLYQRRLEELQGPIHAKLESVAKLKVGQVSTWRNERLASARVLEANGPIINKVRRWLEKAASRGEMEEAQGFLKTICRNYNYSGFVLLDPQGHEVHWSKHEGSAQENDDNSAIVKEVLGTHEPALSDIHVVPGSLDLFMSLAVPVFDKAAPAGAIVFFIDARKVLFPLVETWPVATPGAETLIVRRDNEYALFLTDSRFEPDDAMNLRIPLTEVEKPTVRAALGYEGEVDGRDYRGIPVLAVTEPVPDTRWHLVAKIDVEDALGEARRQVEMELAGTFVALSAAALVFTSAASAKQRSYDRELARREAFERSILENAGAAIIAATEDGVIRLFNPEAESLTGYAAAEVIDKEKPDLFLDAEEVAARGRELSASGGKPVEPGVAVFVAEARRGKSETREWTYVQKSGRRVPVVMTVTALRDETGAVNGFLTLARDITERKSMEQALQSEHARLEESVRLLEVAKKTAEAANYAKSEFLANMSHEIRTPMNSVLGAAQLLREESLSAHQSEFVTQILEAGRTLLGVINDILDFSKVEAGQLQIDRQPFALAASLARIGSLLGNAAHAKDLNLHIDCPPELQRAVLMGDALRLEQILINLVGNAVKFTAKGDVWLRVTASSLTSSSARLRFEVQDTGVGIDSENAARLFEPFVQADGATTRRFGGSGLGLSISRRLVELMGGVIGAEGVVGKGSTFWFELPFDLQSEGSAASSLSPRPAPHKGPRLSGLRCLVADDIPMNRVVIEQMLTREGAQVTLAADGQQALQLLEAEPDAFDAVLMDVQMPVMDGLAATRAIRNDLGLKDLPVIALTAGVLPEQRQQTREAGCTDFLRKPVDRDELVALLLRVGRSMLKA
jgi:signal transduction histidine kinase/ActR/RegA family two-component response regulator